MEVVRASILVFACLGLVLTAALIWNAGGAAEKVALFAAEAVEADALVFHKYTSRPETRGTDGQKRTGMIEHHVVFRFELEDGRAVEVDEEVGLGFWEQIKENHIYVVTYPVSEPMLATLYPDAYQGVAGSHRALAVWTAIVSAGLFALWWFLRMRARRS